MIVLVPFSQLEAASVPSFDVPFTRVNEREEGRISHERECAKGEGRSGVRRTEKQPGRRGCGREEGGERVHGARSGKTEIQFERCMLDPHAGSVHFEIGFVLLRIRFARRSELTAESRTRKERVGRGRGRVAGKGKGRV